MGNVLLDDYKKDDPLISFEKWLQQNPELTGKQVLAENKLFLTSRFSYNSKQILLKVYFKRDNSPITQLLKSFQIISKLINQHKCVNLLPLAILNAKQVSEKNLIIATRQYLQMTLQDKLQRRPALTIQQKKWMIFQMIMALEVVHNHLKIYHGNVRTSNFLVTSYDYLMLTDFANYKPPYILEDTEQGLAEFRLFYPSSQEKCTLSPQKLQGKSESAKLINKPEYLFNLYKQNVSDLKQNPKASFALEDKQFDKKQPSPKNIAYLEHMNNLKQMDMFSLGLCILEVLNDGKSPFSYESLLNLKKGKFSLEELIQNAINSLTFQQRLESPSNQIKEIKEIVTELLLKKSDKPQSLIERFPKIMKNQIHMLLWHCLSSFSKISFQLADHRIYLLQSIIQFIERQVKWSNYNFVMKPAKCLEKFNPLKIFAQIIKSRTQKSPLMFSCQVEPNSILGQIISSVQKKDTEPNRAESEDQMQTPQANKRQSFFIDESKKKRLSKRQSFMGHFKQSRPKKVLCPPEADHYLEKLVEECNFDIRFSKLNLKERKKAKLQMYLHKIKADQSIREEIKSEKSYFYADFELIAKIIFSCLRNCQYVASKMLGIQLLNILSAQSSDSTLLRVILPYLIDLSQEKDVNVAKYAFNSLLNLCYNFVDPFETEQDIAYYHLLLDFLINTIKGSNIRSIMFTRFEEIYSICEWLEVVYLRIHQKFLQESQFMQSHYRTSVILQPPKFNADDKPFGSAVESQNSSKATLNFYKLVDQLKISYGTFTSRQIQQLMVNIPIAILPEMFEFYISFLNTQKTMGLKCSLFIAQNATKEFQMQRYIIDVFDNCMQSGLSEIGLALCYSIKYFTIRKNINIDIVHKVVPHIINPHRWVRQEALEYVKMCLEQFPPAKIFFLFRDVFDAPFPLTPENLSQQVLLPEPLTQAEVNFKDRKFTNRISRKIGMTEKKFLQYLKLMKTSKENNLMKEAHDLWESQTKQMRLVQVAMNPGTPKLQVSTFISSMRKTIELLYVHNFFFFGFALQVKYNPVEKEHGLNAILSSLNKLSKFNLESTVVTQQQKQFFDGLNSTINLNFEKFVNKMAQQSSVDKLKLSICINLIAEQVCILNQIQVKPTLNLGESMIKYAQQRNFKPRGIQVSQIYENKQTISGLVKAGDYFFVSASHDGSMRVYDTRSIQMNIITEAGAVYDLKFDSGQEKMKINSLTCLENTYTAVVATNKGQLKGLQIQRMPSNKNESSRYLKSQNQVELFKYNVGGDIQKITAPKSPQFNQCVAYITSESILGVQDIRSKDLSMKCNIGKQRGYCLSLSSNDFFCLLVGTVDGYLLTYDIRFNLLSSALQLCKQNQSLPITNIIKLRNQNKFCITYPSSNYQFAQFSSLDSSQTRIEPSRLYYGMTERQTQKQDEGAMPSIPYFENKTNDQVFKLCNNNLEKHIYYSELSNFDHSYKILDYVSQPLTLKESKIREMWANGCRHRYNQVLSIYNKKCVPFVEYFPTGGILTNFNPNPETLRSDQQAQAKELTFLIDKKQQGQGGSMDIDREMTTKTNKIRISQFDQTQNKQCLTHCAVVNGFVAVACKNSRIKLYR